MNFNKSFVRIKNSYNMLHVSYGTCGCKTISSVFNNSVFRRTAKKYVRILPQISSFSFYSSAAEEEQVKLKSPDPVITIPPLEFADVTFDKPVTHADLSAALHICDSVEEQMNALTSTLSLSSEDIENRILFTNAIESLLKPFFGELKIQIFGSTLNGFGFKGCDIDLSFQTFADESERISYLDAPDIPLVSEVIHGKVSPREISLLPRKEQLLFIHSVLLEYYRESDVAPIFINAHVPLIRFHHDKYGLKCDLTAQNGVAFANTKLLYLFGRLDERVIPLLMTIRYWGKHVELIGKGLLFNTYTVSLLVIHFLQTRTDPILPSAEYLMSLSDSLGIQDMSDTSFLELQKHVPVSKNNQTLSELLKDFFFYYMYFDFSRVICPLIGGSVSREEFFSNCSRKFRMNSICVQDPMDVKHNVAELVDYKTCKKFFTELMIACRLFQNSSDLLPQPSKWGIACLLDKTDEYLVKNQNWNRTISFTIPHITKQVIKDIIKEDMNCHTAETLLLLLRKILLFECVPLEKSEVIELLKKHDEEIERKKKLYEVKNKCNSEILNTLQKLKKKTNISLVDLQIFSDALMLEEFQKISSEYNLVACFECKTIKNTWLGRNHISVDTLPISIQNDLIEKEQYISVETSKQNELLAKNTSFKKVDPFAFICECYISPEVPESLLLIFRPLQKANFNPVLGIFLKEYLPELIRNLNKDC